MPEDKKIAIVYDWIDKWGGIERVLLTLNEIYPEAEFFTSYFDKGKAGWAKNLKIRSSFIQRFPDFIKGSRVASFSFYPFIFESFDFTGYDLVISVTSSFAKAVVTRPETLHICYLLTPARYLWIDPEDYLKSDLVRFLLSPYLVKVREWDFVAAQRPDKIISISKTAADRCKKYYLRDSEVIYPPFDPEYWHKIKAKITSSSAGSRMHGAGIKQKYFLVVSRLESYKKVDLLLQSINELAQAGKLKQNLIIVGEGSQSVELKSKAGEKVTFLSQLSDEELGILYSNAEALIMPQEEDFGYVSLEAQFFGCPVIAYNKGGATETVIDGKTGIFFEEQSVAALKKVLLSYDMVKYDLKRKTEEFGPKNGERFAKKNFKKKLLNLINY